MNVYSKGLMCVSALALSACSFTPREQAEGNFDYTNVQHTEGLKPAPGKRLPVTARTYEIPQADTSGEIGQRINVLPPVLVRGTAAGSRPSNETERKSVDFSELEGMSNLPEFTWEGLKAALSREAIAITDEVAEQQLTTGWVAENWVVGDDELEATVERRFKVFMNVPDHRRTANVAVEMIDKRVSGAGAAQVPGGVSDGNAEANLLNSMINEVAVRQQGITAAATPEDIEIEATFNDEGFAAYQLNVGFDVAWVLMSDVLEGLGFDIDDLNQSTGMYYTEYRRDGGFSLAFWQEQQAGQLDLPDGDYQINVKGDRSTSTVTIYQGETPLSAADIDRLYGPIAAEIRRRSAL
ncbi:outer membrane protein assembly factor BamC [Pseudidiomarina sediminum]|uniref:Outer membrane protein assembly factor BamC n=1 Tax=Pseudidiomarina sediminum TaxID=431675 RepID=A0A432Z432_9GAMM|nr:outer membrane protein assembly factor BamC [Pseudidiomarina sediminum]RUO72662.1 outer membrane protein assembly factor BamC [Pseudidiomarina sediminum]